MWDRSIFIKSLKNGIESKWKLTSFLSSLAAHRYVRISYEALIQDPEKVLHLICERIGIEFDEIMLGLF